MFTYKSTDLNYRTDSIYSNNSTTKLIKERCDRKRKSCQRSKSMNAKNFDESEEVLKALSDRKRSKKLKEDQDEKLEMKELVKSIEI